MPADGIADNYSVGLMYSGFGLKAGIATRTCDRCRLRGWGNGDDQEMIQAGASHTFNNFSVGAQYESDDNYQGQHRLRLRSLGFDRQGQVRQQCRQRDLHDPETKNNLAPPRLTPMAGGLAAEHNFSKRTKVYVAYATEEDDKGSGRHRACYLDRYDPRLLISDWNGVIKNEPLGPHFSRS